MKTLLAISLFALIAVSVQAQSTTNLIYRITVESANAGVTNQVSQSTIRLDAGNKRDQFMIAGISYAYSQYLKSGGTNTFDNFLKTDIKDRLAEYGAVKSAADNAVTAQKIVLLLNQQPDLLTPGDLANLAAIAQKAP